MTLPSSGPLTFAQIQAEIDGVGAMPITIPNADWRTLAGKPTGSLVIPNDFWGKSWRSVEAMYQATTSFAAGSGPTGVSFGDDVTNRRIAVLVCHENTSSNPGTTPSCTIAGGAATRIFADSTGDGSATATGVALFTADPSGTSGDITATWGAVACNFVVLRVVGYDLSTAYSSQAKGGTDMAALSINIPTNGLLIGFQQSSETTDRTWTGLTERGEADTVSGTKNRSFGWDLSMSAQTGRSVTHDNLSAVQGLQTQGAASFSPL